MGLNRRQLVAAGISAGIGTLVLGGCSSAPRSSYSRRPTAHTGYPAGPTRKSHYQDVYPSSRDQSHTPTHPGAERSPSTAAAAGLAAIGRSSWTRSAPVSSKVNPMGRVNKITVHHEGWNAVWFSDQSTTAQRIEKIRRYHVEDNRWGDIGYHYIVDRAGRVWEGRPLNYQGAHVRNNNAHNIGILVLGNFETQSPSNAQLKSLYDATASLSRHHGVRASGIRSHKEINPTTCPGKNLQRQMDGLRNHVA